VTGHHLVSARKAAIDSSYSKSEYCAEVDGERWPGWDCGLTVVHTALVAQVTVVHTDSTVHKDWSPDIGLACEVSLDPLDPWVTETGPLDSAADAFCLRCSNCSHSSKERGFNENKTCHCIVNQKREGRIRTCGCVREFVICIASPRLAMILGLFLVILSLHGLSDASAAPPGAPLFLSQYLPNQPGVAKKLSQVQGVIDFLHWQSILCRLVLMSSAWLFLSIVQRLFDGQPVDGIQCVLLVLSCRINATIRSDSALVARRYT
jgi:hypothetical protein